MPKWFFNGATDRDGNLRSPSPAPPTGHAFWVEAETRDEAAVKMEEFLKDPKGELKEWLSRNPASCRGLQRRLIPR